MTKRMRNALVAMTAWAAIGVFAVADPLGIFGASISISWEAPTTRENGATLDPETEIAEYVIYAAQGEDVDDTEEVLRVTGDLRGATLELVRSTSTYLSAPSLSPPALQAGASALVEGDLHEPASQ